MIADEWKPLPMNPEDTGWIALAYRTEQGQEVIVRRTRTGYECALDGKMFASLVDLKPADTVRFETAPSKALVLRVNNKDESPREKPKGVAIGNR